MTHLIQSCPIHLIFVILLQMDHDDAVTMPTEAQLRKWAGAMMKDSRFMQLPADLARLMIEYVSEAAIEDHKSDPYERAKEILWRGENAKYHICKCGDVVVGDNHLYNGTMCDSRHCEEGWVCTACVRECQVCRIAECIEHRGTINGFAPMHVCDVCKCVRCTDCYNDSRRIICIYCKRDLCGNCVSCVSWEEKCKKGYGCMVQN